MADAHPSCRACSVSGWDAPADSVPIADIPKGSGYERAGLARWL
jgi:hypothetical protein